MATLTFSFARYPRAKASRENGDCRRGRAGFQAVASGKTVFHRVSFRSVLARELFSIVNVRSQPLLARRPEKRPRCSESEKTFRCRSSPPAAGSSTSTRLPRNSEKSTSISNQPSGAVSPSRRTRFNWFPLARTAKASWLPANTRRSRCPACVRWAEPCHAVNANKTFGTFGGDGFPPGGGAREMTCMAGQNAEPCSSALYCRVSVHEHSWRSDENTPNTPVHRMAELLMLDGVSILRGYCAH